MCYLVFHACINTYLSFYYRVHQNSIPILTQDVFHFLLMDKNTINNKQNNANLLFITNRFKKVIHCIFKEYDTSYFCAQNISTSNISPLKIYSKVTLN